MAVPLDRTKRVVEPFRLAFITQRRGQVSTHPYSRPSLSGFEDVGLGQWETAAQTVMNFLKSILGGAHVEANQWVTTVQNPFGVALGQIVDEKDASIANGTATRATITAALNGVVNLWAQYKATASAFAAKGSAQATVIQQSYETLTPLIAQIEADMRQQIAALPAGWLDFLNPAVPGPGGVLTSGPSTYLPVLLGVAAIWWISKKKIF